jgi:RsiW-degrading membrane proteinase PrsW (M82 family)
MEGQPPISGPPEFARAPGADRPAPSVSAPGPSPSGTVASPVRRTTTSSRGPLRRWSWLPVLAVGVLLYELVLQAVQDTGNPLYVPTLILLGASVVPVAFVGFIAGRRLEVGVSAWLVTLTALLGGVVGVLVAGSLEYQVARGTGSVPLLAVGLIEEMAKLLVPAVVLLLFRRNRHPADGLVLGVACGAGFAVLETMGYALVALVDSGGNLAVVNGLLLDRGLLSPAAHMAWTGLTAAALWRTATDRRHLRAVARFAAVYLLVSALHAAWDSSASSWTHAGLAVVSLGLLMWTTLRLVAPHRRWSVQWGAGRPTGQPMSAAPPLAGARSGWRPAPTPQQ